MPDFSVRLTSVHDVKEFVEATSRCSCDVDVLSGRYVVDGKSIMGMFSISLSGPVAVRVHGGQEECDTLRAAVSAYLAD